MMVAMDDSPPPEPVDSLTQDPRPQDAGIPERFEPTPEERRKGSVKADERTSVPSQPI